ncbi:glycosyltransferase [Methylobacterium sp. A54F]
MRLRVLIAVTHLLGAGHLTRAAALARALAGAGHAVTLASGGRPAPLVSVGNARLVQLPPVHVAGTEFGRLLGEDGAEAGPATLAARRQALLAAFAETEPDVVVTELFPFGRRALAGEFLALAEAARARGCRLVASVRDILVAPEKPGRAAETGARVAALYDAVLVHGDPGLVPLDASWTVDGQLRGQIRYTGYVDEGEAVAAGPRAGIVVSAGSSAAGLAMLGAAARAARLRPDLGWRLLVGHGVPEPAFRALAEAAGPGVAVRAQAGFRRLLAGAALSVSQCGYNTAVDLLAAGPRALLVPFAAGRETEQTLRAERLAALGLARMLPEAGLTAEALLAAAEAALADPLPPAPGISRDGAARSVALIEDLALKPREISLRGSGPAGSAAAWEDLRAALDGVAAQGAVIPLFWRDDDAVTWTPALERLLALAGATACPLLVAAIPARADQALAERLAAEPGVRVAVHGLAHANHAPPGEKPAEFGAHRPRAVLRAEAAAALGLARARFGTGLLPVFVPPWNRLAPELAAALPGLGYAGLSAVPGPAVPGLRRADADLDPIDWRGGRSLIDPERLLLGLARRIAAEPDRPIGLLTHHLAHDAAVWRFVEDLLHGLVEHPAVRPTDPRDLFAHDAALDGAAAACPSPYASDPPRRA